MITDLHSAQPTPSRRPVSWKLVLALSVLPGGGHLYLGYPRRGLLHLASVAALLTLLSANILGKIEPFFTLLFLFVILHTFLDAYRLAALRNDPAGEELLPPPETGVWLGRTAQAGLGLVSIAGGALALLVLRFGVDLRWLLDWWPVTFIALGLWLLLQAFRQRR